MSTITSTNRPLGKKFEIPFNVYPNKYLYKPFSRMSETQIRKIGPKIISGQTPVLSANTWAKLIPDLLANALDIIRLMKRLPPIISQLSLVQLSLFAKPTLFINLDPRFLTTLANLVPEHPQTIKDWIELLSPQNFPTLPPILLAYLVPVLIDHMPLEDKRMISKAIALKLQPKDFIALKSPNFFHIKFNRSPIQKLTIKNNGLTLQFHPVGNSKTEVEFQGKTWHLDHTHIHFEDDGEQGEFILPSPPNKKIAAEVHNVFKRITKKNQERLMVVGFPLVLGKTNKAFENIFQSIKKTHPSNQPKIEIDKPLSLPLKVNFKKLFMNGFKQENNIYFSWASPISNTDAFKSGLRFNIGPKPIEISQKQYKQFHDLFGDALTLQTEDYLQPTDRKGNFRPLMTPHSKTSNLTKRIRKK